MAEIERRSEAIRPASPTAQSYLTGEAKQVLLSESPIRQMSVMHHSFRSGGRQTLSCPLTQPSARFASSHQLRPHSAEPGLKLKQSGR